MIELTLRAQLKYDVFGGPTFCRFLPLRESAQWRRLGGTQFDVRLYIDPKEHRGWVTDIDLAQIERHTNPSTTGLFIELRTNVDDQIAKAIADAFEKSDAREATHEFAAQVLETLRTVHAIFVGFVRHDYMQYWLRPWENHRLADTVNQRLAWYDARWEMPDSGWKVLHPQCSRCQIVRTIVGRESATLTKEAWSSLEKGLSNGSYRAKPHRRLLANAFAQFDRHELRAAIIEGVAAWEMVLGSVVPTRLAEQHIVFEESKWKAILEKTGLRAGTDLVLGLVPQLAGTYAGDLLKAVERRNNVIHGGATRLDAAEIERCLWALRVTIGNCEGGGAF